MTSTGNGFEALKIVSVDRMADGLLVTLSEGTVAMFHTQFLYDVRHDDNNVVVLEQGKPNTPSL